MYKKATAVLLVMCVCFSLIISAGATQEIGEKQWNVVSVDPSVKVSNAVIVSEKGEIGTASVKQGVEIDGSINYLFIPDI